MVGTGANGKTYRFLIEVTTIGTPEQVERRRQRQPLYLHDLTHLGLPRGGDVSTTGG